MTQPDTPDLMAALQASLKRAKAADPNLWHIQRHYASGPGRLCVCGIAHDEPVVSAPLVSADAAKIPQSQPDTLHTRLRAEIDRRLAVARAANAAKPGDWVAVTTHDGSSYDGLSRVIAVQMTADRTISRHVADGISDVPEPVRAGFEDIEPEAADVAEHIALHDPADAIRRYEGELEVLERHQSRAMALGQSAPSVAQPKLCWRCNVEYPCADLTSLAHRLGVSVDA